MSAIQRAAHPAATSGWPGPASSARPQGDGQRWLSWAAGQGGEDAEDAAHPRGSAEPGAPRSARPGAWFERSQTTALEKAVLAATAAVGALRDPTRADLVAALGDTTSLASLRMMRRRMLADEVGREILAEQPVVKENIDLAALREMPAGSFGRAYAEFMDGYGFEPEGRPNVKYIDDPDDAYVMLRYREVHDFLHVLTGLGTSVEAEIIQKWLELLQTGLPMTLLSATVGPLRLAGRDRRLLLTEWAPWAARTAVQMPFFLNIYYERLFAHDLQQLRRELDIPPLPRSAPSWQK